MKSSPQVLRDAIKTSMHSLLSEYNGLIFGHNLTDVGWVAGTLPAIPDHPGYVELPITDIAGIGIAVGSALSAKPVVFISRYQGYLWFNLAPLATYAAISRTVFEQDCWFMMRSIADDGAFGPVASGSYISLATQVPELNVCAPSNTEEWDEIWRYFLSHKQPLFVAEHRATYENDNSLSPKVAKPEVTILAIGGAAARLREINELLNAANISNNCFNILWLKPLKLKEEIRSSISESKLLVIIDVGRIEFGISAEIERQLKSGIKTITLSGNDHVPGYSDKLRSRIIEAADVVNTVLGVLK
jgi:pyruvate/2-oxoglutarate/acetoin dehydrogenase E1 component